MPPEPGWKYWIAAGAAVALVLVVYTPARQFHRFFLTECAADGPAPETELDIDVQPVDLAGYYGELRAAATGMVMQELASVSYAGERWPIYLISPAGSASKPSVLVVAGVHGNEVSGSLAAVKILESMSGPADATQVHLVAPANPVGLAHGSRYNALGCDINRDFAAFRTEEARAIRSAIDRVRPQLVIALHEGPQDGVFVIGTRTTPMGLLSPVIEALKARDIPLATENNLGVALSTPGLMIEGPFITKAKGWLGIQSLGEHTSSLGIPLMTTEVPWNWPNMEERIDAQTAAVLEASQYGY